MSSNDLPTSVVGRAMQLASAVHDYDSTAVRKLLGVERQQLNAMCVALAAMVNIDHTPTELFAWNDGEGPYAQADAEKPIRQLQPHGTHSAFIRHKSRGEQPCDRCVEGERTYQRLRSRRRRSAA